MATTPNPVAAEQDAAAEAPDLSVIGQALNDAPDEAFAKPKPKVTRKPTAAQRAKTEKAAGQTKRIAPTMREIEVDGQKVKVAIGLSDADAEKYARRLLAKDSTPEADVDTKPVAAKPAKKRGMQLAEGEHRVRINLTTWMALVGKDGAEWRKANAKRWNKIKSTEKSTYGATFTYFVPMTKDEVASIKKWMLATAKAWEKAGTKGRLANPKFLNSNAAELADWMPGGKRVK